MWFTETPWPPIILFSVLAVGLVAGWYTTRRGAFLAGVGGLAVACVATYFIERQIVTESEQIEANVLALAAAFQRGDLVETLEFISLQEDELRAQIVLASKAVTVHDDLRITDMQVEVLANDTRAVSHFRANATISVTGRGNAGRQPSRWELTWQKEAGEWRVMRVERLNPINGEPMRLMDRSAD